MPIEEKNWGPNSRDVWDGGAKVLIKDVRFHQPNAASMPLCPGFFYDVSRRDHRFFRHENYPHLAVEMTLSGAIEYRRDDDTVRACPGNVYIIVPGSTVRIVNASDRIRRKLTLLFLGTSPGMAAEAFGFLGDVLLRPEHPEAIENAMRDIGSLMENKADIDQVTLAGFALLLRLRRLLPPKRSDNAMSEILRIMERENGDRKLSAAVLAAANNSSVATLRRKFIAAYGIPPMAYLGNLRLKRAELLINNSVLPLKEIANMTGFTSLHSFSLAFRNHYGFPPSSLRREKSAGHAIPGGGERRR